MKLPFPFALPPLCLMSLPSVILSRPMDVYAPPVLEPHQGDTWVAGETRRVVWDASTPPQQITNPFGVIRLRKGDYTDSPNLASGFSILDGSKEIIVPNVTEGADYRIVLFGDSGNWSDFFRIVQPSTHHHPYHHHPHKP